MIVIWFKYDLIVLHRGWCVCTTRWSVWLTAVISNTLLISPPSWRNPDKTSPRQPLSQYKTRSERARVAEMSQVTQSSQVMQSSQDTQSSIWLKSDLYLRYSIEDLITPHYWSCSVLIILTNQSLLLCHWK